MQAYRRNLGLEELQYNADGTIQKVTFTTDGVKQLGHLDPYVRVEAETTNAQSGVETEPCMAGGMDLTNLENGDWVKLRGVDFGSPGAESFRAPEPAPTSPPLPPMPLAPAALAPPSPPAPDPNPTLCRFARSSGPAGHCVQRGFQERQR